MMIEQFPGIPTYDDWALSGDPDIAAVHLLGMFVTRYAEATIRAAVGEPMPGSGVLDALDRARRVIDSAAPSPAPVAGALHDLQVVAVIFAMQLAVSGGGIGRSRIVSESDLRQVEDELVAALRRDAAQSWLPETRDLGDRALDYMREIVIANDRRAPIGSAPVERSIAELHVAAVAFARRLAISEGCDPASLRRLRRIKDGLVAALADREAS